MEFPGRKLSVVFRRNESKDEQVGAVEYTGYDAYWPTGYPIRGLAFDRFCKIGVRYLLGREKPRTADVDIYFVPLAHREVLLPRVPGCRLRVLYLDRVGDEFRMFLSDETPTEIAFDLHRDERAVLDWIGERTIAEGGRQWFALYAVNREREMAAAPSPLRSRHPATAFPGAPRVDDGSKGRYLVP